LEAKIKIKIVLLLLKYKVEMTISDYNFSGKRALIRVDFNVPLNDKYEITDDTRIRAALPTIQHVLKSGGSVVLISHFGRPKNGPEEKFSMKHLLPKLSELLGLSVKFAADCISEEAFQKTAALLPGEVILLENLRFYKEETAGDADFSKKLAKHGDVYVNDAFGTAHRAHASTAIIVNYMTDACFGLLMESELSSLDRVLKHPQKPVTAIIGGAKVSSKITIIENLLTKVDNLIIGGGMTYTFAKALGGEVGNSLVEEDKMDVSLAVIEKAKSLGVNLIFPEDSVIADEFSNDANRDVCATMDIPHGWMGLDAGEKGIAQCTEIILKSKTILWNGPMGVFEMSNFENGTKKVAEAIAQATDNGAYSLIGGGDSVAAINKFNLASRVSYVSTGGGAMLEFLEGKELPGVAAIRNR
jgi:phosphoglycerate kinase